MITFLPTTVHTFLSLDIAGRAPAVILKTAHIIRKGTNYLEGIDICSGRMVEYPSSYFSEITHNN